MSSRTRSDFGTLGDRVAGARERRPLPCHIWVDGEPGVLVAWERRADGWWGRCLHVVDGVGMESLVRADSISPLVM